MLLKITQTFFKIFELEYVNLQKHKSDIVLFLQEGKQHLIIRDRKISNFPVHIIYMASFEHTKSLRALYSDICSTSCCLSAFWNSGGFSGYVTTPSNLPRSKIKVPNIFLNGMWSFLVIERSHMKRSKDDKLHWEWNGKFAVVLYFFTLPWKLHLARPTLRLTLLQVADH